jgi:CRISPR-associated protein Cas5d
LRNQIEYKLCGPYALFTDPITRVGGEKCTVQIPTYQALKGITESIYWKPTIIWYIDEVRVMNPIRTESKNIRPINFGIAGGDKTGNTLSIYTYLRDVEYRVRAHFEFNLNRPEMEGDRNENKHHNIAKRMVELGGRRDIFLGTRECQGYVEPCAFDDGTGFYDDYGELSMGFQFHGFNYPDETGREQLGVRLWNARMENGIIRFPRPELFKEGDPAYPLRIVREGVKPKLFVRGENAAFLEDEPELEDLGAEEDGI